MGTRAQPGRGLAGVSVDWFTLGEQQNSVNSDPPERLGRVVKLVQAQHSKSCGIRHRYSISDASLQFERLELRAMLCSVPIQAGPFINETNGHTYYLLESSTWEEAESSAMELGGNLVTINDEAENAWVYEKFGNNDQFGLWIGLNDQQTEGEFVWSSGESVAYTNWAGAQPDDYNGAEDHVMLFMDANGKWADYSVRSTTAGRPLQGVVEVPSFINPANGHTYIKLSPSSWSDAEERSIQLGGHLVTINHATEQDWVTETFSDPSQFGLWTGLNYQNEAGQFVWSSGQRVTYTNWGDEQPDSREDDEDFAVMLQEDGGAWHGLVDDAHEQGTSERSLHAIMEYEGILNTRSRNIVPDTESIRPGSCGNFDGRNLQNADLAGRNLTGSSFIGTALTGSSFQQADITNVDLTDANIRSASFSGVQGLTAHQFYSTASYKEKVPASINLNGNDLTGWDLRGQNLSGGSFESTTFTNTLISGASFRGTTDKGFTAEQLYSTASYKDKDLAGIDLGSNDLTGWDFHGQDLTGVDFWRATLTDADFTDSIVGSTKLTSAVLHGFTEAQLYSTSSYKNKDLRGIDLASNNLTGWDFRGQNLSGAMLWSSTLSDVDFTDTILSDASIRFAAFGGVRGFTVDQLYSTASYQARELDGVDFAGFDLTGWDFSEQNLNRAGFEGADLTGALVTGATLEDANLREADLTDANLSGVLIRRATFDGARGFTANQLYSTASYQNNSLRHVDLSRLDLTGWDFSEQNLAGATFSQANLTDAIITGAGLSDTTDKGFTSAQMYSTASYQNRGLMGIDLGFNDLTGWDFSGQDLSGASFRSSNIREADFTDAIVAGVYFTTTPSNNGLTANQLYSTKSYQTGDLTGIDFSGELFGWDFSGQDLTGAQLGGANLSEADLTDAIFTDATIEGASLSATQGFTADQLYSTSSYRVNRLNQVDFSALDLTGWDFSNQNLTQAGFSQANLTDAIITEAVLSKTTSEGFTAEQLYSTANYQNKDLRGIRLDENNLAGWDFSGQDLSESILSESSFQEADFTDAILTKANLEDSNLWQATFTGATIIGAKLSDVRNFNPTQMYSTANYQAGDLQDVQLGGNFLIDWDFSNQDLTGASLQNANLDGADFTGAIIRGTVLSGTRGFTADQLYSTASYQNKDLREIQLRYKNMEGWDLSGQNLAGAYLRNANLSEADLTDANLTYAEITAASFSAAQGFTAEQLYSTSSYQNRFDLYGVDFSALDLTGWDFSNQGLAGATFSQANLTDAIIKGAGLSDTTDKGFTAAQLYSSASYQNNDLKGIHLGSNDLTGWDFSGQDLSEASFSLSNLSEADFTDAIVAGAYLTASPNNNGLTATQLYSTKSYQTGDLTGIDFSGEYIGWDFSGQNLSGAGFDYANLNQADFSHANLTDSDLGWASLIDANLTSAKLVNASLIFSKLESADFEQADLTNANLHGAGGLALAESTITTRTILPDGELRGLHLEMGEELVLPRPPKVGYQSFFTATQVTVTGGLIMEPGSSLTLGWASAIMPTIGEYYREVTLIIPDTSTILLNGSLRIAFSGNQLDYMFHVGNHNNYEFHLFDWGQPLAPNNSFDEVELPPGAWDLTELYTTGVVRRTASYLYDEASLNGDFNVDGVLTAADIDQLAISLRGSRSGHYDLTDDRDLDEEDHRVWVENIAGTRLGDANLDQTIDFSDFLDLSRNFGESGGWADGDFNADGTVDFADFLILSKDFGWSAGASLNDGTTNSSPAVSTSSFSEGELPPMTQEFPTDSSRSDRPGELADTAFADDSLFD